MSVLTESMVDVAVKVPVERVAEFYAMFGHWLSGDGGAMKKAAQEGLERGRWTPADEHLAAEVWGRMTDSARALFSILIDHPGREFSGDELAELLGMSGRNAVAGLFGQPGTHCRDVDRERLWDWRYPDGKTVVYWMTPEVAALFRSAQAR